MGLLPWHATIKIGVVIGEVSQPKDFKDANGGNSYVSRLPLNYLFLYVVDALFPLRMVNKFGLVSNTKVSRIFATDVVTSPMMKRIVRFGLKVKGLYNLRKENLDQCYVLLLFFC